MQANDVKGAVNLDTYTFNKLVGGAFDVLVKFDKQYPYGDKEDAWKEVANRVGQLDHPEVLLAQVGVQDYGDKLNSDLQERFGVETNDFPVFMMFKKGSSEGTKYTGEVTTDGLTRFLVSDLGIYIGLPGCVEALDKAADGYLTADASERTKRLADAEAALAAESDAAKQTSIKSYVNVMKKVNEKGADFPTKEAGRLEKLVQSKITEEKKALFRTKLNILPSFK